jgi:single-stranded-DNA-specific exonuclease
VRIADIGKFGVAFEQVVCELLTPADLERIIETDGPLDAGDIGFPLAEALDAQVWGQGFAPPAFFDRFDVAAQRVVGSHHLKLRLRRPGSDGMLDAILFNDAGPLPNRIEAVYRLQINEFNGARTTQLVIEHWRPEGA